MNSTGKAKKEDLVILEQIFIVLEANKNVVLSPELTTKLLRLTDDYKKGVEEVLKDDAETGQHFKNQILPNYENWVKRLPNKPKYK